MTTETTKPDLVTEVEELLETHSIVAMRVDKPYKEIKPLLRRLVEEVKRDRDALRAMVELWDANHADDPCACTGADYSVGQHPVTCELCVARELMEGRNPNAE